MDRMIHSEALAKLEALGYRYNIMEEGYVSPDESTIVVDRRSPYIRHVQQFARDREEDFRRCVAELDRLGYLEAAPIPTEKELSEKSWYLIQKEAREADVLCAAIRSNIQDEALAERLCTAIHDRDEAERENRLLSREISSAYRDIRCMLLFGGSDSCSYCRSYDQREKCKMNCSPHWRGYQKKRKNLNGVFADATKKLRLFLWADCHRDCEGCCNKQFDLPNLPVCENYEGYDLIMLTGGEPMLYPDRLKQVIAEIREQTEAPIVLYTAKTDDAKALVEIMELVDGITVTLHQQSDVLPLIALDERHSRYISAYCNQKPTPRSYRINVFKGVDFDPGDVAGKWNVKDEIEWIPDCPLPEGETLQRYGGPGKKSI